MSETRGLRTCEGREQCEERRARSCWSRSRLPSC